MKNENALMHSQEEEFPSLCVFFCLYAGCVTRMTVRNSSVGDFEERYIGMGLFRGLVLCVIRSNELVDVYCLVMGYRSGLIL